MSNQVKAWTDRWGDVDAELDRCDDEPSLGFRETYFSSDHDQTKYHGGTDDREGDGCADDREGDEELHGGESEREDDEHDDGAEPSLGWPERMNQAGDPGGFMDIEGVQP
jgi:hypothetical protein